MVYNARTRTLNDVYRAVKRVFGDESAVVLEDEDLRTWTNQGQQYISSEIKSLKARSTAITQADVEVYSFPDMQIRQIEAVHLDGRLIRNLPFQEAERTILDTDPRREDKGEPEFWYMWDDELFFYPVPEEGHVLELFYTRYPRELTSADETLDVPDKQFDTLVNYVLKKAYEMSEDMPAAQYKQGEIQDALMKQSEEEYQAQHMSFPTIREVPLG